MHPTDISLLIVRLIVGLTLVAHGWNHAFGGGKITGTARWFESLGPHPGRLHAYLSALTETGCGLAVAAGFLTPPAVGGCSAPWSWPASSSTVSTDSSSSAMAMSTC
jgi:putative oxidoreductase